MRESIAIDDVLIRPLLTLRGPRNNGPISVIMRRIIIKKDVRPTILQLQLREADVHRDAVDPRRELAARLKIRYPTV